MTDISTAPTALTASLNLSGVNVTTNISGQTVLTSVSGNTLTVTGSTVVATTSISGNVVSTSGNVVNISGNNITEFGSSLRTAAAVIVTSASGGVELSSGVILHALVRGLNVNSGALYLGGTGTNAPFSGQGLVLAPADPPVMIRVDNLNDVRVFAQASGDRVSFTGVV
jgi:hypothetical protein